MKPDKPYKKPYGAVFLLIAVVLIVYLGLFAIQSMSDKIWPHREVSFSEFVKQAKKGSIETVTITEYKIYGQTVEGDKFYTYSSIQYEGLVNLLIERGVKVKIETTDNFWLSLFFNWGMPFLFLIFIWSLISSQVQKTQRNGQNLMSFGRSRAKLNQNKERVTFADVAGVDEAKEELQETIEFLKNPAKFSRLGGRLPKGVLLIGPPGTGKTLLAKAVAGKANVPFFSISGSNFVEMFVGVGASRVRDLFEQGKRSAPCIIFIDEIDAVGRNRSVGFTTGVHEEREQTLNQLLAEMDGFESNTGVIIIAASNRPEVLDPALTRPGRFDRQVVVNLPDIKGREEILKIHTKHVILANDINLTDIARGTPGFSGADLANLVNEAALNASRYDKPFVTQQDLEFAIDKVTMGSECKTLIISSNEKRTTAIHEAGHALVSLLVPMADPLHKVTIIPRGMALGLTKQIPTEDRHNFSKTFLESQLAILMGGRCAEEIILGQQTTGAKSDIERATEIAYRMVSEWGMSELGPLSLASGQENPFPIRQFSKTPHNYSEATAQKIDKEIRSLIEEAYEKAKEIITEHREAVEKLAAGLIEREVLDGEEVRKIAGL